MVLCSFGFKHREKNSIQLNIKLKLKNKVNIYNTCKLSYNLLGDYMEFKIDKLQAKDIGYLRLFKLNYLEKGEPELLIYKTNPRYNITVIRPYNLNKKIQQLSELDVFRVLEEVKQWFPLEFKDFNKEGLNIRLMDCCCDSEEYVREKYKCPDLHLLCKLKKNTLILFRNSHLSKQDILARLERIFIHEMTHIKWSKLPLYKRLQYYLAYKADGGFSPSLHTKGNIKEDIAVRTEEFIKFRKEFESTKKFEHRFKFIKKWLGIENII